MQRAIVNLDKYFSLSLMRSPRLQWQTWLMALPLASQQRPHWTQRCLRNGLTLNEAHESVGAANTDGPVPIA
jgi:hypothetical protein